jgi:hypothetical protein
MLIGIDGPTLTKVEGFERQKRDAYIADGSVYRAIYVGKLKVEATVEEKVVAAIQSAARRVSDRRW